MGLADIHQYQPSRQALEACDLAIMVGGRLDNQMNFGNAPLFPDTLQLVCVNGSFEELEMNRSADHVLLSDPGAFFDALLAMKANGTWKLDRGWFDTNRSRTRYRGCSKKWGQDAPLTAVARCSGSHGGERLAGV
ncbi:MAG: hypothetical protein RLZZ454_1824 [Pseudomonadota bacterium]